MQPKMAPRRRYAAADFRGYVARHTPFFPRRPRHAIRDVRAAARFAAAMPRSVDTAPPCASALPAMSGACAVPQRAPDFAAAAFAAMLSRRAPPRYRRCRIAHMPPGDATLTPPSAVRRSSFAQRTFTLQITSLRRHAGMPRSRRRLTYDPFRDRPSVAARCAPLSTSLYPQDFVVALSPVHLPREGQPERLSIFARTQPTSSA